MKKYTQLFVVLILTLTIVGISSNGPAWAGSLLSSEQPSGASQPASIKDISESGTYTVGGLCEFNAVYTGSGASADVAVDVPANVSRKVPYTYDDELYLAGCHIVHYALDMTTNKKIVTSEMSPAYGSWEVCFGDRPGVELRIYYYPDNPETGSSVWSPLVTTHTADGFACAPAIFTGVYAPGGIHPEQRIKKHDSDVVKQIKSIGGTVKPPPPSSEVTKSGTYSAGGICTMIVDYYVPNLSNDIHVEDSVETSANVPFPDNEGLLYLPGCHVFHYKNSKLRTDVNVGQVEGSWTICFAVIPNKITTIYFYYAKDDRPSSALPDWAPLETTIENGMACTPVTNKTAVYAPVGK